MNSGTNVAAESNPHEKGKVISPDTAKAIGKPLWSSEDKPDSSPGQVHSREWKIDGRGLAKLYNDNYLEGGFTATEVWSPVSSITISSQLRVLAWCTLIRRGLDTTRYREQSGDLTTFLSGVTSAMYCIRLKRTLPFESIQTSSYSQPGPVE
jgi:hypothetical protein